MSVANTNNKKRKEAVKMASKMTRKERTMHESTLALNLYHDFYRNWDLCNTHWERLYRCNAQVGYDGRYYVLRSYNSFIAFYDTKNDVLVDMLRYVYGYTATSAQHIVKFRNYLRDGFLFYPHLVPTEYTYR